MSSADLAPRKRLPTPQCHVHPTTDHAGRRAHAVLLGASSTPTTSPPPPPSAATSFQIYSTTPFPADPAAAQNAAAAIARRLFVSGSGGDAWLSRFGNEMMRFDVYDARVPLAEVDVVAAVQHQRREIDARQGTASAVPRFAASARERGRGLVLVVTGRLAGEEGMDGEGEGEKVDGTVLMVWFRRDGEEKRVRVPRDLDGEGGGEGALERTEVEAVRVRSWGDLEAEMRKVRVQGDEEGGELVAEMRKVRVQGDEERGEEEEEDEGVDEEEADSRETTVVAEPPELKPHVRLDYAGNVTIGFHNTTNAASASNAQLYYVVYDLTKTYDTSFLRMASCFTSELLGHLPPGTTITLEFRPAPTITASIQHFRNEQAARPDRSVGYLPHPAGDGLEPHPHHRIFPCSPQIEAGVDRHRTANIGAGKQLSGFRAFLVALETKNWKHEDSVLLVRADADIKALRQLGGSAPDDENAVVGNAVELLVGRPPGMKAVAERLAGIL